MCEYMINFIHKLKHLPEKYMMNSVLENFTILQVKRNQNSLNKILKFNIRLSTSLWNVLRTWDDVISSVLMITRM